ncbi:MAG: radical SAM protein [Planctomycetia bacterium]|nr:radical SAM protein [Planctomycetia bacterium]
MTASAADTVLFKDQTADELHRRLSGLGVDARLARRLQAAVVRGHAGAVPAALDETPRRVLDAVRSATSVPRLEVVEKSVSPTDGFAKYLLRGDGPEPFEAVRIPLLHRPGDEKYVVCVSSQVGCAMACAFCATGRLGFRRNLAVWEIVDQVMQVQADSPYPVRGVVFMGMGEPFLNYDRVLRAAAIMSEPVGLGIAGKAITISTVGIVPQIRRFTADRKPFQLVVSLTSLDPERRPKLLPVEQAYPLPELRAAVQEYHAATRRRIKLAWTMMSGINCRPEDARQLAEWTAGLPVIIDLIDVNDATGRYRPPDKEELQRFRDALTTELGMPVMRRYSGGQDVHGGCGMLAGLSLRQPAR